MTEYDEEFWGEELWGDGESPVFSDNGDDLEHGFACGEEEDEEEDDWDWWNDVYDEEDE